MTFEHFTCDGEPLPAADWHTSCGFCDTPYAATIPHPQPGDTTCSSCMGIVENPHDTRIPDVLTVFEPDDYIPEGSTIEWRNPRNYCEPRGYDISIVLRDDTDAIWIRPIGIRHIVQRITRTELLAVYRATRSPQPV